MGSGMAHGGYKRGGIEMNKLRSQAERIIHLTFDQVLKCSNNHNACCTSI